MTDDEKKAAAAIKVGVGTAIGVGTALANAPAPHLLKSPVTSAVTNSAAFSHAATKALRSHKGWAGAITAGTAAVVGHGAIATALVTAAPVVVATAVVGGGAFGVYKLAKFVKDEWL